jgi:hypothetical protein
MQLIMEQQTLERKLKLMMRLQQKHFYAILGLVCFFATSASAVVDPFDTGPYPLGWWDQLGTPARATEIAAHGGTVSVGYLEDQRKPAAPLS